MDGFATAPVLKAIPTELRRGTATRRMDLAPRINAQGATIEREVGITSIALDGDLADAVAAEIALTHPKGAKNEDMPGIIRSAVAKMGTAAKQSDTSAPKSTGSDGAAASGTPADNDDLTVRWINANLRIKFGLNAPLDQLAVLERWDVLNALNSDGSFEGFCAGLPAKG